MGTVYCGLYAEEVGYEHEGYADRKMSNGEFSNGEWSDRYPFDAHVAFVAACGCGWRGSTEHRPTDAGEEAALDEWDVGHLQPLIRAQARRHTINAETLIGFIRELRGAAIATEIPTPPDYVTPPGQLRPQTLLTERAWGLIDAAEQLEHLLDHEAHQRPREEVTTMRTLILDGKVWSQFPGSFGRTSRVAGARYV
jgi:hypothetical protein